MGKSRGESGKKSGSGSSSKIRRCIIDIERCVDDSEQWSNQALDEVKYLRKIQSQLIALQKSNTSKYIPLPNRTESDVIQFQTWLETHHSVDLKSSHIQLTLHDNASKNILVSSCPQITLTAGSSISSDQLILSIPESSFLGIDQAKFAFQTYKLPPNQLLDSIPSLKLAVHLVHELSLSQSSSYHPYLQVLPNSYPLPMYFTDSELVQLAPSHMYAQILQRIRNHYKQYCQIYSFLQASWKNGCKYLDPDSFGIEVFDWAVGVTMTRQNRVPSKLLKNEMCLALVPAWDMMNHARGPATTSFNEESRCVEFRAMKDLVQGEAIEMFYGPRPNSELLMYSGFVFETNEFDIVPVSLQISSLDPLKKIKNMLIVKAFSAFSGQIVGSRLSNSTGEFQGQITIHGANQEMILFASVACMDKDQVGNALRDPSVCMQNAKSEQVLQYLHEICLSILAEYPSDDYLATVIKNNDHSYSTNQILIAQFLKAEKSLIQNGIKSS